MDTDWAGMRSFRSFSPGEQNGSGKEELDSETGVFDRKEWDNGDESDESTASTDTLGSEWIKGEHEEKGKHSCFATSNTRLRQDSSTRSVDVSITTTG